MLTFYYIPRRLLLTEDGNQELLTWLEQLGPPDPEQPHYVFGRRVPGTIAFFDPDLALLFRLRFGTAGPEQWEVR